MKTLSIIKSLVERGIYLLRDGDKIKCRAPKGAITDAARNEIKNHKGEILTLLEYQNPYNLPVVAPNYNLQAGYFVSC